MTAEEYLNEHCKPEDWNNLEECLKDSILTNNVIEHMERYAALRIHAVTCQREQLLAFAGWLYGNLDKEVERMIVDDYLKGK